MARRATRGDHPCSGPPASRQGSARARQAPALRTPRATALRASALHVFKFNISPYQRKERNVIPDLILNCSDIKWHSALRSDRHGDALRCYSRLCLQRYSPSCHLLERSQSNPIPSSTRPQAPGLMVWGQGYTSLEASQGPSLGLPRTQYRGRRD